MKRHLTMLVLLSCLHCIQSAELQSDASYALRSIVHTPIPRAADLALAPDDATALTCMNLDKDGFLKFDTASGELLSRHLKREFYSQKVFLYGNRLLFLTDTNRKPEFRVMDCQTFELLNVFPLKDWRLYRISSATLTSDGRRIWIGTMPASSSRYGEVDSALFCLDVSDGSCLQVAGDPPEKEFSGISREQRTPWMVCADATGGVVAIDPKRRLVIFYKNTPENPKPLIKLNFTPTALPQKYKRFLPVAGEDSLHVLDLKTETSIGTISFKGKPLSVCVDAEGTTAFVTTADSSTLLQFSLPSLKTRHPIDLSRPNGDPETVDAHRGKAVSDLIALRWANNPDRIIVLGYHGYIFITARLENIYKNEPRNAHEK